MLSAILASLTEAVAVSDEMSDGKAGEAARRWERIRRFLETRPYIMNADVRALCGVSAATANRILAAAVAAGQLRKCRENGHWAYRPAWDTVSDR